MKSFKGCTIFIASTLRTIDRKNNAIKVGVVIQVSVLYKDNINLIIAMIQLWDGINLFIMEEISVKITSLKKI